MDQNRYSRSDFATDCTEDSSEDRSPTTCTSSLNHFGSEASEDSSLAACSSSSLNLYGDGEDDNDDRTLSGSSCSQEISTKQRHSLIEKRRRKKMNSYIVQLSSMIPSCRGNSHKLDKITILQKTVQHIKSLQGSTNMYCKLNKPSFLTDEELKQLVKMDLDGGFLFAIDCQGGKFLHVSEAMVKALGIKQRDLLGQSIFDILHNKDVAKVKEQLSSQHDAIKDSNSLTVGIGSGSWRSFYCRLKHQYDSSPIIDFQELQYDQQGTEGKSNSSVRQLPSDPVSSEFFTIHCKGFIKSLGSSGKDSESNEASQNCLVVIAHIIKPLVPLSPYEKPYCFDCRLETDGKFIAVDQNAIGILGYLPQELLGTSVFDLYHQEDLPVMIEVIQSVLNTNSHLLSPAYRCRKKDRNYVTLQSDITRFVNPRTKLIDFIMCHSTLISSVETQFSRKVKYSVENGKKNSSNVSVKIHTGTEGGSIGFFPPSSEAAGNEVRSRKSTDNVVVSPRKRLDSEGHLGTPPSKSRRGYFGSLPTVVALSTSDNKDVAPYFGNSSSVLQNSWFPTPDSSPVVQRSVSRSPLADYPDLGITNYPPLKNGLRHHNLINKQNACCDSGPGPSETSEPKYTAAGSQSEDTSHINSKNVFKYEDLCETYNTDDTSAMAVFLSLLEDDMGLGEINMSDFSWSI